MKSLIFTSITLENKKDELVSMLPDEGRDSIHFVSSFPEFIRKVKSLNPEFILFDDEYLGEFMELTMLQMEKRNDLYSIESLDSYHELTPTDAIQWLIDYCHNEKKPIPWWGVSKEDDNYKKTFSLRIKSLRL